MADPLVVQIRGVTGWDTINFPVVPIVFVPGVMGSRLSMPGGLDWDPDSATTMLAWAASGIDSRERDLSVFSRPSAQPIRELPPAARVELGPNSPIDELAMRTEPGASAIGLYQRRGWGGAVWSFYRAVLMRLELELNRIFIQSPQHPVFCFGYDWRRSNQINGELLKTRIAEILARNPQASRVIVVTHSMGGLVARSAVQQGAESQIAAVIHTVLPSNGAVVAYRRFQTGAVSPIDGDHLPDKVLQAIMGSSRVDYARIQSGLPGPMELLPNHLYATADGSPWLRTSPQLDLSKVYGIYRNDAFETGLIPPIISFPGLTGVLVEQRVNALVESASTFHTTLGNTYHPRTFVMFANAVVTDVAYDARETDINRKVVRLSIPGGDGTVPADSGRCPGVPSDFLQNRQSFPNLEHATVFNDSNFLDEVMIRVQIAIGQSMSAAKP